MTAMTNNTPATPAEDHLPPAPTVARGDLPLRVIESRKLWQFVDLSELWRYRELLLFMVWRDVMVRYKQTVLGVAWAVIQPLAQMLVFTIFFGKMAEVNQSDVLPYAMFAFIGLLAWTFFANSVALSSGSVVSNQNLITKVYFPRLFIPASAVGVGVADLLVAFLILPPLMMYYYFFTSSKVMPNETLLFLPVIVVGLAAATFGVGAFISALTVAYRDFRHVVPFMVQIWMFATPTVYMDVSRFGPRWQAALPLNPVYGLIKNFRYALTGQPLDFYALNVSLATTLLILLIGCYYFRRVEQTFADVI
jgi:lipopolysaccharide transport system permease protein